MSHDALLEAADAALAAAFGAGGSDLRRYTVPGRLEVLGKHTDYAGGRSLLCAAERGIRFVTRPRADARVRIVDAAGGNVEFVIAPDLRGAPGRWANYPMTVARRLALDFPGPLRGADVAFASDLPPAAGMSSSSALVVGFAVALADVNGLEARPEYAANIRGLEGLAGYLGAMESGRAFGGFAGESGVGTAGGSEDHTAILCCREGQLSQYAFCPIRHERSFRLPPGWIFAVGVSGVVADKNAAAREDYNRAARAVDAIMEAWRADTGRADTLLADALAASPDAAERMRAILRSAPRGARSPDALLARFDQFVEESTEIVPAAGDCLARGDVEGIGLLVDRSQRAAERWLGNQVPETSALARAARKLGAAAASAFGAGFGGAVWALVETARAAEFLDAWAREYRRAFPARGPHAQFFLTRPGPPLRRL